MYVSHDVFITWMERLMDEFHKIDNKLNRKEKLENCLDGEVLLDNQDVCLLLKISMRSLQYYRSSGRLPYHKISGKVYYKSSDVHRFIRESFDDSRKGSTAPGQRNEQSDNDINQKKHGNRN